MRFQGESGDSAAAFTLNDADALLESLLSQDYQPANDDAPPEATPLKASLPEGATVVGEELPEGMTPRMAEALNSIDRELLDHEIEYAIGTNRSAALWKTETTKVGALLYKLMTFRIGPKDGKAITQGSLRTPQGCARQGLFAVRNHIVQLDFDAGHGLDYYVKQFRKRGLFAFLWTTASHLKTVTHISETALVKWLKKTNQTRGEDGSITSAQAAAYLKEEKKIVPEIADSVSAVVRDHDPVDGMVYKITHAPMPRYRALLILKKPFVFDAPDLGTHAERRAEWSAKYVAFGQEVDALVDSQCKDAARLSYTPSRAAGHPNPEIFDWYVVPGDALDFDAIKIPEPVRKERGGASNAESDDDATWRRFVAVCWKHFNAADYVLAHGDDPVEKENKVEAVCPNKDAHSTEDSHGTLYAINPENATNKAKIPVVGCNHAGCADIKGPAFVRMIMLADGHTVDDLLEFVSEEGRAAWEEHADFETDSHGVPYKKSQHNIGVALARRGISLRYDVFADHALISKDGEEWILDDATVTDLRLTFDREYGFLVDKDFFFDVISDTARANSFHPVADYLSDVESKWDGVARVDTWLTTYLGAEDNKFNSAAGVCWLIAAVRRIRQPGCKFDEMPVFESEQGLGKSSALAILAVNPDWFTDNLDLTAGAQETIEQTAGKWLVEIAEMQGMRKGDIEHVKAQLSRPRDRARPAYGRIPVERPRQFVLCGTTNGTKYLKDPTGNRRFWPVKVSKIAFAALERDVDQLWAEAATRETLGESIRLDPELWGVAAEVQAARQIENPYVDALDKFLGDMEGRIPSTDVYEALRIPADRRHQGVIEQVCDAMRKLGWGEKKKIKWRGTSVQGFAKGEDAQALRAADGGGSVELVDDADAGRLPGSVGRTSRR